MVDAGEKPEGPWWQTVPGVLTAAAAVITAVTGLILALYQSPSSLGNKGRPPPQPFESHEERQRPVVPVVTPPAVDRPYNMSFDMLPV